MKTLLRFCLNASLGLWLGASVFLLALTAALFSRMPDVAGRAASLALPLYFQVGAWCALAALAAVVLLAVIGIPGGKTWKMWALLVLVAGLAGINYYGGWVVLPAAREERIKVHEGGGSEAGIAAARERFQRLHRLSTRMFGAEFFLLVVAMVFVAFVLRM